MKTEIAGGKDHERTELEEDTFKDCLFGIVFVACPGNLDFNK